MKRCCFIVPYFGKFPETFPVFLKTCKFNKDYDWIFFTDIKDNYDYPENVRIINMSFEEIKQMIQEKFNFNIYICEPHKLCDYKPAYGYIFEQYISEYKFWGHCDIDTIMGDLNEFITDDLLQAYDKLFCLGHFILYKNTYKNNRIFMKTYQGRMLYKESFSSGKTTVFDETFRGKENINSIYISHGFPVLEEDLSANFLIQPSKFIKTTYNCKSESYDVEDYKESFFIWNEGKIFRYWIENGILQSKEFMYMHFQLRKMKYDEKILKLNRFKIIPEVFTTLEHWPITEVNFDLIKKKRFNLHFLHMKIHNYKDKKKKWMERKGIV